MVKRNSGYNKNVFFFQTSKQKHTKNTDYIIILIYLFIIKSLYQSPLLNWKVCYKYEIP